eukprot:gene5545-5525_t
MRGIRLGRPSQIALRMMISLAVLASLQIVSAGINSAPVLVDLFTSGVANGNATGNPWVKPGTPVTYRIPSLVSTNSTLVAFASERLGSTNDESPTNIVQRVSHDWGATWGPLQLLVLSSSGMSSAPWAIAGPASPEVFLFYNSESTSGSKCSCGVSLIK